MKKKVKFYRYYINDDRTYIIYEVYTDRTYSVLETDEQDRFIHQIALNDINDLYAPDDWEYPAGDFKDLGELKKELFLHLL